MNNPFRRKSDDQIKDFLRQTMPREGVMSAERHDQRKAALDELLRREYVKDHTITAA